MFYIYHIPTFVHKNGRIGKIGCTKQKPATRVRQQGYTDFEILETHEDKKTASDRERILQIEYGYPVDKVAYISISNVPKTHRRIMTEDHKRALAEGRKGSSKSQEFKDKVSATMKGLKRPKKECPHCGRLIGSRMDSHLKTHR